jgi:hypothetical protein
MAEPEQQFLKPCASCKRLATLSSCAKCANKLYCTRQCQLNHWDLHKPTCSKLFELFDSTEENGGKGLRATTNNIKAGDEISRESAVMRCPNGHAAGSEEEAQEMHQRCITDRFARLTAKNQRAVMDLSSWDKYNNPVNGEITSYGIYQTNSLRLTGKDSSDGGVFLAMCRSNHSCRPNVHYFWREDLQKLLIIALEDIALGDELYGMYGPSGIMDTAGRREHLSREFGFICMCSMCNAEDKDRGDTRMREANRLCEQVRSLVSRGEHKEAIKNIDRCLVLLTEQRIGEGVGARQLLSMGYQVSKMGLKDERLARHYLERELKVAEKCEGVGSPSALAIQKLL